jgi:hypothetical protein
MVQPGSNSIRWSEDLEGKVQLSTPGSAIEDASHTFTVTSVQLFNQHGFVQDVTLTDAEGISIGAVPEPASFVLVAGGCAALVGIRRRLEGTRYLR